MKTLTQEEAKVFGESGFWEHMTFWQVAMFQLNQPKLCMPFSVYHEAVEKACRRPVYNIELARPDLLRKELLGEKPPGSLADMLAMIPKGKPVIVVKQNSP